MRPLHVQKAHFPSNFLEWGEGDPEYVVLVDKSLQKIMLFHNDNLFVPEKVYFGSCDEKFYCLNANDGHKIWEYTTHGTVCTSAAISEGKVVFGSGLEWTQEKLYCLDAETGGKIWTRDITEGYGSSLSSPKISNGRIYIFTTC